VKVCTHVGHATAGWYEWLTSATWKSVPQPDTRMACPVLFSTTTRAEICDPAVIVRDGSTTRADIDAAERRVAAGSVGCALTAWCATALPAHPVTITRNASRTSLGLMCV